MPARGWRAIATALIAIMVVADDATAAGVGGATWSPSASASVAVVSGFRTFRDSIYVYIRVRWDRAERRGLRGYEVDGLRYTQEVNDISGNLSATGFWVSDIPGAEYDRDDDDGDGRWEEAEVTVAQAGSIRGGRSYFIALQFARWSRACESDACAWRWTHRAGRVVLLSQLSSYFLGEWQAQRYTDPWAFERYPRMRRPPLDT